MRCDAALLGVRSVLMPPRDVVRWRVDDHSPAAVLVLLVPSRTGELRTILTERDSGLPDHAGEIAFPGGRAHPEDATPLDTALREASEEIGLVPASVEIVGGLRPVTTDTSRCVVYPFVARATQPSSWRGAEGEVGQILEIGINDLSAAGRTHVIRRDSVTRRAGCYVVGPHVIWGVTAEIVDDLLTRLRHLESRASAGLAPCAR